MALGDAARQLGFAGEARLHRGRPLERFLRQIVAIHPIIKCCCILHFGRVFLRSGERRGELRAAELLEDRDLLDPIFDQRSAGLCQRPVCFQRACPIFLAELQRRERAAGTSGVLFTGGERAKHGFRGGELRGVVGMSADDGCVAQN